MKQLVSVRKFSQITGIGYKRSRQLVSSGAVPSKPIGSRKLISVRWIERWLEESATANLTTGSLDSPSREDHA